MRVSWKIKYFISKNSVETHRSSIILGSMVRSKFWVHNGRSLKSVVVEPNMVNLKLGEFLFTRKIGVNHKKKLKIKKGKKK